MTEQQVQDGVKEEHFPEFLISQEQALQIGRSLPLMIVGRMSYADRQTFGQEPDPAADVNNLIKRVVDSSGKDPDFLLPDTPLKEAIFRVILSHGNDPMTAEDISEILSERWAMTAYPRNVTPQVIQRLLENSKSYCIVKVPEPEDLILEEELVEEELDEGDEEEPDSEDESTDAEDASDEEESED
ncbi:MAG: hypothetical protein O2821_06840 [Chloroflexi bacterium]|nr:hypothetical protein [Chloroflexota bacterium]MDA1228837.1 hypothetical protein [Chloroflexota bacterium]